MHREHGELRARVRSSAVIQNPALFEAIGIAPAAAMAVSLKSAIMLAAVSGAELLLIEMFACLALKRLKSYFRVPIYALLGMLINIPFFLFFEYFTPNETNSAGIFLPLLAVNSLIALHCERFAVKNSAKNTCIDALSAAAGYAVVVLAVGLVREILGSGTVYSVPLHLPVQLPGFLLPFGGLLLLGFFAATLKAVIARRYPNEHPEAAFSLAEVSQSHIGRLKTLLDAEFDPYDEGTQASEKSKKSGARSERPKKHTRQKADKIASRLAEETQSPTQQTKNMDREKRESYLLDFDEMLTELDAYKLAQEKSEAAPPAEASDEETPSSAKDAGGERTDVEKQETAKNAEQGQSEEESGV